MPFRAKALGNWPKLLGLLVVVTGNCTVAQAADKAPKLKYVYSAYGYSSGQAFSRPSGVFYDAKRDELYVADTGNGQIVILDNKGTAIGRIAHSVYESDTNKRRKGEPRSVVVLKSGDILVADGLCNYIDILDFQGRSVQKVWPADLLGLDRAKVRPGCLAVDASGNVYVSVSGDANSILVLTAGMSLKAEIGKTTAGGSFKAVTGLWVDKEGRIYVTYAQGECVRVYAPDGKLLTSFGTHDSGRNNFSLPSGLVTDAQGNVWVVDTMRHVVSVFKTDVSSSGLKASFLGLPIGGRHVTEALEDLRYPGDLLYPAAIAGDGSTRIFVVERTGARVQAFELVLDKEPAKAG